MEYFVTSNGIPVHVSETGKGDTAVLLLHGYLETLYIWEEFRSLLPESSHIVSIDLPGMGLTGTDPQINTMQFDAKVVCGVLDKLSVKSAFVIGHSMGGYVGQRFIKDFPDRISGLVNVNSNPYADDPSKASDRQKEIDFILNGKLVQLAQIAIPNMYAKANLRKCDETVIETVEICETHDPEGVAAVVRGLQCREDNVSLLNSTSVPVMFVYGDSDIYTPLSKVEKIKSDLPSCRHEIVPSTGHNTHVEDPAALARLVADFALSVNIKGC